MKFLALVEHQKSRLISERLDDSQFRRLLRDVYDELTDLLDELEENRLSPERLHEVNTRIKSMLRAGSNKKYRQTISEINAYLALIIKQRAPAERAAKYIQMSMDRVEKIYRDLG